MLRLLLVLVASMALLWGVQLEKMTFPGYISKVAVSQTQMAVGLENGKIQFWKWGEKNLSQEVTLPQIEDFMGDKIAMPIYSLDFSPDGSKLLIVGGGEDGKRNVFVYNLETGKLDKIWETKITLMKGAFTNDGKIFFALLSDEALLFNPDTKKIEYRKQVGNYVFSQWAIEPERKLAVFGDESGAIKVVDIDTGEVLKIIDGYNKDKTVALNFNGEYIANGSADTRISLYNYRNGSYVLKFKNQFIPYGVATSPDNRYFAYQLNENNDIEVMDLKSGDDNESRQKIVLKGHTMALNGMKFLDNTRLLSYSPAELIIWNLAKDGEKVVESPESEKGEKGEGEMEKEKGKTGKGENNRERKSRK
jgi:WD40 repeat protein